MYVVHDKRTPLFHLQVVSYSPKPGGSFMLSMSFYADTVIVKYNALAPNLFNDPVNSDA